MGSLTIKILTLSRLPSYDGSGSDNFQKIVVGAVWVLCWKLAVGTSTCAALSHGIFNILPRGTLRAERKVTVS